MYKSCDARPTKDATLGGGEGKRSGMDGVFIDMVKRENREAS